MSDILPIDVISIQSEVTYGHVGNNAVIPVLQHFGLTTATVPTVYYSNTPLYPSLYGGIIPDDWFTGFLQALTDRDLLRTAKAILLGYLGSPTQAEILADWLTKVRQDYPHLLIQIDPVLGDTGCGLYVDERLAVNYRERLHKLATGMTPNHFELEYLCGRSLSTLEETVEAAKGLLSDTTQWIITTSAAPSTWANGEMQIAVITHDGVDIQTHKHYNSQAQGTGDTFAAHITAYLLNGETVQKAARLASEATVEVVRRTLEAGTRELKLIEMLKA